MSVHIYIKHPHAERDHFGVDCPHIRKSMKGTHDLIEYQRIFKIPLSHLADLEQPNITSYRPRYD